jgi:hypothetical protein
LLADRHRLQAAPSPRSNPARGGRLRPRPATATPTANPTPAGPSDPWTKSTAAAGKRDPLKRPLLWSIAKGGRTTYILGTMHMGIDAEARLPQIVWDKLDAAPVFAMETDLTIRR